jgi:hypothetical protein
LLQTFGDTQESELRAARQKRLLAFLITCILFLGEWLAMRVQRRE